MTPSTSDESESNVRRLGKSTKARRQLSMNLIEEDGIESIAGIQMVPKQKKNIFGRNSDNDGKICMVQPNTRQVYALVNKMTGSIGGNGE